MMPNRHFLGFLAATAVLAAPLASPAAAASVLYAGTSPSNSWPSNSWPSNSWPSSLRLAAAEEGGRTRGYHDGKKALDEKDWKGAARIFRQVAAAKGADADAALYWLAYALRE